MNAPSWPSRLRASPELFPLDFRGPEIVQLVALGPADYERASFLDERLARSADLSAPYGELAQAAAGLPAACDFIFHTGHVGSTLIARVLGRHPQVFALREPQILRSFAEAARRGGPWDADVLRTRLGVFVRLFSRTWEPEQRSVVKATSLVSELAAELLALETGARALMVTVAPETYLATILGGPNSRLELGAAAPGRAARLERRIGPGRLRLAELSEGETAAMSWACEMTALAAAAGVHSGRAAWIDFEVFLADPRAGLAAALAHLRRAADAAEIERIARSGYLERYAKAPEYAYGREVRRQVLDAARRDAGAEIRRGLAWLEAAAAEPQIAEALAIAEAPRHVG